MRRRHSGTSLVFILLAGLITQQVQSIAPALLRSRFIGENYEIRQKQAWLFDEPLAEVLASDQEIYPQVSGPPVLFQVRVNTKHPELIYYTFINSGNGSAFPLESKGNYVIRRSLNSPPGQLDQVKIFLTSGNDPESAIRLTPGPGDSSLLSVILYGKSLYQDYTIPYPLTTLARWPLARLVDQTREWIDWLPLLGSKQLASQLRADEVLNEIRPLLPLLSEAYDGALDQDGHFVRIETGVPLSQPGFNCSGFVKWVVDGIYRQHNTLHYTPTPSKQTTIDTLKERQIEQRGQLNAWNQAVAQQRDPYFGLDWSRALAAEVTTLERGAPVSLEESDVRDVPFFHYYEDVGYQMEDLDAVLYLQTMIHPGALYLATVNGDFGNPPRHQYYHLAVLVPTFDERGDFVVHVLDTTEELTLARFQSLRPGTYVHLNSIHLPYSYTRSPLPQPYEQPGLRFTP